MSGDAARSSAYATSGTDQVVDLPTVRSTKVILPTLEILTQKVKKCDLTIDNRLRPI
jgi:hypothetical protein